MHCNNFSDIWDGITDSLNYYAYIMLFKTNKNSSSEIFGGVASNLDASILAFDSLSFCFRSSNKIFIQLLWLFLKISNSGCLKRKIS